MHVYRIHISGDPTSSDEQETHLKRAKNIADDLSKSGLSLMEIKATHIKFHTSHELDAVLLVLEPIGVRPEDVKQES